jgi:pyruvate dehydrogenase E2 component (dihydrolipoamide acetyltransferase)
MRRKYQYRKWPKRLRSTASILPKPILNTLKNKTEETYMMEVKVPDIGDFKEVEVIELLVKPGDTISVEQSLITVESDKASMEIPSVAAGVVKEIKVKIGDKVAEGSLLLILEESASAKVVAETSAAVANVAPALSASSSRSSSSASASAPVATQASAPGPATATAPAPAPAPGSVASATISSVNPVAPTAALDPHDAHVVKPHASPSIRKFARELGVDLAFVRGTGPKQRITEVDVRSFVKGAVAQLSQPGSNSVGSTAVSGANEGAGLGLIPWPKVDFAKFGPIESKALSRIKKLSGANLHRNWVMIPHVTNCDDADISDLEAFRVQLNKENEKSGVKVTMLAFLIKACVSALKKFPEFNASLDGDNLVLKQYFHIGFAADTPNGLMVPVIKDADKKGIFEIAKESAELAGKAREGKLSPSDMQGGCFSISSLGGIGGTYFTPIINAPEVAILGVCRSAMKPVWDGKQFEPRLMLPMSLSWDHRVIDGASAARFNTYLAALLADFRRVML